MIKGKILDGSTIYTDGWKAVEKLILNGYDTCEFFIVKTNLCDEKIM